MSCFGASAGLGTSGEELYGRPGPMLNEAVCLSDDIREGAPEFDSVIEDRRKLRLYLDPASAKKSCVDRVGGLKAEARSGVPFPLALASSKS